jgi:hypothetical protein
MRESKEIEKREGSEEAEQRGWFEGLFGRESVARLKGPYLRSR